MAKQHGCMYRIDVLKQGKDARGQTVVPEEDAKEYLGKGIGFSTRAVRFNKREKTLISCFEHSYISHKHSFASGCQPRWTCSAAASDRCT
jgi:hypothetical protein